MNGQTLRARLLTREAFAPYGDVIELESAHHYTINDGWAERYHDLAALDLLADGGRPAVSIFRGKARPEPVALTRIERHPLSSQAFIPLSERPFLVVVASRGEAPADAGDLRAFVTNGRQGVNYRVGVWHHPLLPVEETCDFVVLDRVGPGDDCEEVAIGIWGVRVVR